MDELTSAGAELLAGLDRDVPRWIERRVVDLVDAWRGEVDDEAADVAARAGRDVAVLAVHALGDLLGPEPSDRTANPLELIRRSLGPATDALAGLGVPPVVRDGFAEQRFPDDVYDLSPATFADIDPELHEPGMVWGVAKARHHLLQRASAPRRDRPILAYAPDLMDQSRLRAAGQVQMIRDLDELAAPAAEPRLVIVDLDRPGVVEAVAGIDAPVVGFHPHEDDALRARALDAGCRDVLTRAQFFRRLPALLASA